MRVDHIGIAVKNLDSAIKYYREGLGLELLRVEEVPKEDIRVAILKAGEVTLELMEPCQNLGVVAKFIEKRGEGIHHISFRVESVEDTLRLLKERGVALVDETPRTGVGGRKAAFLHPRASSGVLIELCEHQQESGGTNSNAG